MEYQLKMLWCFFQKHPISEQTSNTILDWATFCWIGTELRIYSTNSKTKPRKSHWREWKAVQGIYRHHSETNLTSTLKLPVQLPLEIHENSGAAVPDVTPRTKHSPTESQLSPVVITHRFHTKMFTFKTERVKHGWRSITNHTRGNNILVLSVSLAHILKNSII